jgi:hypothetical protein
LYDEFMVCATWGCRGGAVLCCGGGTHHLVPRPQPPPPAPTRLTILSWIALRSRCLRTSVLRRFVSPCKSTLTFPFPWSCWAVEWVTSLDPPPLPLDCRAVAASAVCCQCRTAESDTRRLHVCSVSRDEHAAAARCVAWGLCREQALPSPSCVVCDEHKTFHAKSDALSQGLPEANVLLVV